MEISDKDKEAFKVDEKKVQVMCEWIIKEDAKPMLGEGMHLLSHLIFPGKDKANDKKTRKILEFLMWIGEKNSYRTSMLMLELNYQMKVKERKNDV